MTIDLHSHTTCSDGVLSPRQLIEHAHAKGVTTLAITDHDGCSALRELASESEPLPISLVPGIEVTTLWEDTLEVHILGLGVDIESAVMRDWESEQRGRRRLRLLAMIEAIATQAPDHAEVLHETIVPVIESLTMPGRLHLARLLAEAGLVREPQEAFRRWLRRDMTSYQPASVLPIAEAIAMIQVAGGAAVVAHPGLYRGAGPMVVDFARQAGAVGVEVYHPKHTPPQVQQYEAIARRTGLILTGGSDLHDPNTPLGRRCGDFGCKPYAFECLQAHMNTPELATMPTSESSSTNDVA